MSTFWICFGTFFMLLACGMSFIYWRRDITRRNAYLEIISEAARIRDDSRLMMAKAVAVAEAARHDQEYRCCPECGQIRSRYEADSGVCIECAVKQA